MYWNYRLSWTRYEKVWTILNNGSYCHVFWFSLLIIIYFCFCLFFGSYGSWIYNNLCNQCLLSITLWVQIRSWRSVLDTTLCDKACQWLATVRWFSSGTPVSFTNKTDRHDMTEILLKVALNTITLTLVYCFSPSLI